MGATNIEWTDMSINPIRARKVSTGAVGHYCEKISAGCTNCYASRLQSRFNMPPFTASHQDEVEPFFDDAKLLEVIRRRKPTKFFWCDMSDMFGDWVPGEWIDRCFAAMALTPQHTHQVLTKRADRMVEYIATRSAMADSGRIDHAPQWYQVATEWLDQGACGFLGGAWDRCHDAAPDLYQPLPNVWLGFSAENQECFDRRWFESRPLSRDGWLVWVSAEPLLGDIDLHGCEGLSWIVVGGESGHRSRPCNVEWVRSIVRQCDHAGVPCFVKQLGAHSISSTKADHLGRIKHGGAMGTAPESSEPWRMWLEDKKGGDPDEWPADLRVRQIPTVASMEAAR